VNPNDRDLLKNLRAQHAGLNPYRFAGWLLQNVPILAAAILLEPIQKVDRELAEPVKASEPKPTRKAPK